MKVEIIQNGRVLNQYCHEGQNYLEVPSTGNYEIRLTNNSNSRRLVVLSVDGQNAITGELAGYEGPGYVLSPWQVSVISGWRRSDSEVATFQFKDESESYSAKTGKGTRNTGVIGVAVFDEKINLLHIPVVPYVQHHYHWYQSPITIGEYWNGHINDILLSSSGTSVCMDSNTVYTSVNTSVDDGAGETFQTLCSASMPETKSTSKSRSSASLKGKPTRSSTKKSAETPSLGTGYGERASMHTTMTEFERAGETPSLVFALRYGMRENL